MKKTFIPLLFGLVLAGCSNDDFEPSIPAAQTVSEVAVVADESSDVTKADLKNIVSIFGNGSSENRGRSNSDKEYVVSTIFDSEGLPAIYVINYVDNGGFVLVSATKNYHPVLAFAESGNYDVSRLIKSGLDIWEGNTIDAVKESANLSEKEKAVHNIEWLKYSAKKPSTELIPMGPSPHEYITDEEYEELTQIYYQSINDLQGQNCEVYPYSSEWSNVLGSEYVGRAEEMAASGTYWMYEDFWQDFATVVYSEEYEEIKTPMTVQSKWNQEDLYNQAYPILEDGEPAYAGCGPVAAGQIMRYFQHPARSDWQQMPLNYPTEATSKFLFEIAEAANASYKLDGTYTKTDSIRFVFLSKGYNVDVVKKANSDEMAKSLKAGSPAYVVGWNKEDNKGHAWVAAQADIRSYTLYYDVYNFGGHKSYRCIGTAKKVYITRNYFYYNWGWGGSKNGYFLMDGYKYNQNMQVLLNIKPK